ncbi:MAG: hypothetical protein L6Q78_14090 [Bacteroidia bacterium]|nr:hypothetical protein [Bacteroidia bacterium]
MKRRNNIFIISIIFVFFISCIKSKDIVYVNKNGDKWIREYFPNSKMLKVEGKYRNDTIPVGIKRAYTINGLIYFEVRFNDLGEKQGIFREFNDDFPNGNYLITEGQYYKDKPIGWWRFYSTKGVLNLMMELDSNSKVIYYVRFDSKGHYLNDSIGEFSCDTAFLY